MNVDFIFCHPANELELNEFFIHTDDHHFFFIDHRFQIRVPRVCGGLITMTLSL